MGSDDGRNSPASRERKGKMGRKSSENVGYVCLRRVCLILFFPSSVLCLSVDLSLFLSLSRSPAAPLEQTGKAIEHVTTDNVSPSPILPNTSRLSLLCPKLSLSTSVCLSGAEWRPETRVDAARRERVEWTTRMKSL